MSKEFEVVNGAELDAAISAAQEALSKDPSAPREITVKVKFHRHEEFPKALYKSKEVRTVADAESEAVAAKDGFGPYDHEAFSA